MTKPNLTLEDAQVLKEIALAEKYQEEAADYRASQKLKEAEARHHTAEAYYSELNAAAMRINTEAALRHEKVMLASNHLHHVYEFIDSVHEDSVGNCLAQLAIWHRADPTCDMHIIMQSPGGSVIDGMHLFDQLSVYSKRPWDTKGRVPGPKGTHDTTMTVRGYAASMAGILLQAVDNRLMGPEASLLVHEVSSFAKGKIGELKDEFTWLHRLGERVADIFVARSGGKTTLPDFVAGWNRTDWWLDSTEALRRGFIDRIG